MLKGATARRYAEAAFELAGEQSAQEGWLEDLRTIAEYFGNRQLAFILSEPNVALERKEQVVRDLLGDKVRRDALGLALLLVERNLVSLAPRVHDEFERRYNEYLGQAHAQITTATPLDEETRERVRRDLQEITGKRIILHENVDPSILGGAVARVGDTLIDGSVRRRLALLRQQIIRGGGTFGGPSDGGDGRGAPLGGGPGGAAGGPATGPGETKPFVVTPNGGTGGNGAQRPTSPPNGASGQRPSSATDMAPRPTGSGSVHLAPRPAPPATTPQTPGTPSQGKQPRQSAPGNQPNSSRPGGGNQRGGRSNKRRRR